jgi:hypothetical protein
MSFKDGLVVTFTEHESEFFPRLPLIKSTINLQNICKLTENKWALDQPQSESMLALQAGALM